MKKPFLLFLLLFSFSMFGCSNGYTSTNFNQYNLEYSIDLSQFPLQNDYNWYGKIIEVKKDKLLIEPGGEKAQKEYGELVWLICEDAESYHAGQVVTYVFRDVKAPNKEGYPLEIIALSVYME